MLVSTEDSSQRCINDCRCALSSLDRFDLTSLQSISLIQHVHQMLMEVAANELGQKPPSNLRMKMKIASAKPSFLPFPRPLATGVSKVQSDSSIPTMDQETL